MDLLIEPARLRGAVTPPPSKIPGPPAADCGGPDRGRQPDRPCGVIPGHRGDHPLPGGPGRRFAREGGGFQVTGIYAGGAPSFSRLPRFDCGESGSTLRFLIPIALAVAGGGRIYGPRASDGAAPEAVL